MTPLEKQLIARIKTNGAISVSDYMTECLFNPKLGYYTNNNPFGKNGDFITAPDISQMFGELTAIWLIKAWEALGSPPIFTLCEIGPGRGTWMKDILRILQNICKPMASAARIILIEKSTHLAELQKEMLRHGPKSITWAPSISALPRQPTLFIANELFDALPIRQYVKSNQHWVERLVSINKDEKLQYTFGNGTIDKNILPPNASTAQDNAIFEYAPAREAVAEEIALHIKTHRGLALFIDYGHLKSDIGDTLQAVRNHNTESVFAFPGKADLTSHVDFEALTIAARSGGAITHPPITQADFLLKLGLIERAGQLGKNASLSIQSNLRNAVTRLAGNDDGQMGDLFKVMCITSKEIAVPAPFGENI